jgi:hypothetical protein
MQPGVKQRPRDCSMVNMGKSNVHSKAHADCRFADNLRVASKGKAGLPTKDFMQRPKCTE